jgi:hypothetical protein
VHRSQYAAIRGERSAYTSANAGTLIEPSPSVTRPVQTHYVNNGHKYSMRRPICRNCARRRRSQRHCRSQPHSVRLPPRRAGAARSTIQTRTRANWFQARSFAAHPGTHPPRLSTAAAHPAPEPHGEEPLPVTARSRWSPGRAWRQASRRAGARKSPSLRPRGRSQGHSNLPLVTVPIPILPVTGRSFGGSPPRIVPPPSKNALSSLAATPHS